MKERSQISISEASKTQSGASKGWMPFLQETVVFSIVFVLAVLSVRAAPQAGVLSSGGSGGVFILYFFASFAAATVLLLLLLRTVRGARFFSLLFAFAVFTGVATLTESLFGAATSILATSAAVLLYYAVPRVIVFDVILTLGLAGIAANLGSGFRPVALVIVLSILAFYDIIAVYGTRHMVVMADALVQRKVFFAILLPERPRQFLARTSSVTPGEGYLFLGTGDVTLPALLVASAARISIAEAVPVAIGAIAGLAGMHLIFYAQSKRKPMPALPPIALGAILGYLTTFLYQ